MPDPYLQLIGDLTQRLAAAEDRIARLEASQPGGPAAQASALPASPRKAPTKASAKPAAKTVKAPPAQPTHEAKVTAKRRSRLTPVTPPAQAAAALAAATQAQPTVPLNREAFKEQERAAILAALMNTGWNRLKAADDLKIPRRTFYRRMKEYGLMSPPATVQPGPRVIRKEAKAPAAKVKAPTKAATKSR